MQRGTPPTTPPGKPTRGAYATPPPFQYNSPAQYPSHLATGTANNQQPTAVRQSGAYAAAGSHLQGSPLQPYLRNPTQVMQPAITTTPLPLAAVKHPNSQQAIATPVTNTNPSPKSSADTFDSFHTDPEFRFDTPDEIRTPDVLQPEQPIEPSPSIEHQLGQPGDDSSQESSTGSLSPSPEQIVGASMPQAQIQAQQQLSGYFDAQQVIESLMAKAQALEAQLQLSQANLADAQQQTQGQLDDIQKLHTELEFTKKTLDSAGQKVQGQAAQLTQLRSDLELTQTELASAQQSVQQQDGVLKQQAATLEQNAQRIAELSYQATEEATKAHAAAEEKHAVEAAASQAQQKASTEINSLQTANTVLDRNLQQAQHAMMIQPFIAQLTLLETGVQNWLNVQIRIATDLQLKIAREEEKKLPQRDYAALKWYRAMHALHTSCTLPSNQPRDQHATAMSPLVPVKDNLNAELSGRLEEIRRQIQILKRVAINERISEAEKERVIQEQRQACEFIHKLYTEKLTCTLENAPSAVARQAKTMIILATLAATATTLTMLAAFAPHGAMLQFMHGMLQQFTTALLAGSALAITATVIGSIAVGVVVAATGRALYHNHQQTKHTQDDLRNMLNPTPPAFAAVAPVGGPGQR